MNPCDFELRVNAYHDNELSSADRTFVETHLAECADCRQTLATLRTMSAAFVAAPAPSLSQIGRARLHQNVDRQMERGLVRLSWAISGIAAAVMVLGSAWLTRMGEPAPVPGNNAVVIQTLSDANTPAEVYYLADATTRAEEW